MGRNKNEYDYDEIYFKPEETTPESEIGCGFCWDKRKNENIELYFLDRANNMRPCAYCPSCGRRYNQG